MLMSFSCSKGSVIETLLVNGVYAPSLPTKSSSFPAMSSMLCALMTIFAESGRFEAFLMSSYCCAAPARKMLPCILRFASDFADSSHSEICAVVGSSLNAGFRRF